MRVSACLLGQSLSKVERFEHQCLFYFANNAFLNVECPWRILADGKIAYGYEDHGQQFGLPTPIDGPERTNDLLLNKKVHAVDIRNDTGDLMVSFEDQRALEFLNMSMAYEGWSFEDGADLVIVAGGGGQLHIPKVVQGR